MAEQCLPLDYTVSANLAAPPWSQTVLTKRGNTSKQTIIFLFFIIFLFLSTGRCYKLIDTSEKEEKKLKNMDQGVTDSVLALSGTSSVTAPLSIFFITCVD